MGQQSTSKVDSQLETQILIILTQNVNRTLTLNARMLTTPSEKDMETWRQKNKYQSWQQIFAREKMQLGTDMSRWNIFFQTQLWYYEEKNKRFYGAEQAIFIP